MLHLKGNKFFFLYFNRQGPFFQPNERTIRQPLPRSNERTAFSSVNPYNSYNNTPNSQFYAEKVGSSRQDQNPGLSPMNRTEFSPIGRIDQRHLPNSQFDNSGFQSYNQGKQTSSYNNYYNRPLPERPSNDSSIADRSRGSGTPERLIRSSGTPERLTGRESGTPERQTRSSGTLERPTNRATGTPERSFTRGYGTEEGQSRGAVVQERSTPGMFSNPVRTPERPNSNKYNLEHSPAGSPSNHKVNPNPVRQNFNSLNKFGNDDRFNSQEYSQKFSPSVKNTGNQDFSYQSPRNVMPDRQRNTMQGHQSSSNVHNHVYGTQESIKQLYSSPKDSKRNMYATQDSIRRMYNSPKDSLVNNRQPPPSLRGYNQLPSHSQLVSLISRIFLLF